MKSPSFPAPTLPSAPVSAAIKRIASQWAPPGAFAHHPPAEPGAKLTPRMERPGKPHGPRNEGGA
jgi:hypothetical protein